MKRGKLSKVEMCFIENNRNDVSVKEIASELDRSTNAVKKYIDSLPSNKVEDNDEEYVPKAIRPEETKEESITRIPKGQFDKLMARDKRKTAVVATPAASMVADDFRQTLRKPNNDNVIHKPKG